MGMVFNIEAEQSVIGAILVEGDLAKEVYVLPECFSATHKIIMGAIQRLVQGSKPVDLRTVTMMLSESELAQIGGVSYLTDLATSVPTTDNIEYYASCVANAWKIRQGCLIAQELINNARMSGVDDSIIANAAAKLSEIESAGGQKEFNLLESLMRLDEKITKRVSKITGIPTGYPDLDFMLAGIQTSELFILAARPSVGKTAFALNVGHGCAINGNACVSIFSLETPEDSLLQRMVCAAGNVDAFKMRSAQEYFNDQDWHKYSMGMAEVGKLNLHIYDDAMVTVQEIRAKLRRLKRRFPDVPHVCVIDYLQLINVQGDERNRNQEIGKISRSLKLIARELNVAIIALSQLSRAVEQRQDKRPMLSDLRESGSLEQDADTIGFLYRDDYYDKDTENKNIVEVIIGKQRNGPIGKLELAFLKEYNKFVSLSNYAGDIGA